MTTEEQPQQQQNNTPMVIEQPRQRIVVAGDTMMTDTGRLEHMYRVAQFFAASQIIPAHLRNKPSDCLIALHIADRLKEDPLTVMQAIYIVSGKAGWSSSYMVARLNQSGKITGRMTWKAKGSGADLEVTAQVTDKLTGELFDVPVSMQMAMAEGWVSNKKYTSMPEHMLRWRSATMLIRLYYPEIMLGMQSVEEIETEAPEPRDVTPKAAAQSDALARFASEPSKIEDGASPGATVVEATATVVKDEKAPPPKADDLKPPPKEKKEAKPKPAATPKEEAPKVEDEPPPSDAHEAELKRYLAVLKDTRSPEEVDEQRKFARLDLHPKHLAVWEAAVAEKFPKA